MNDLSHEDSVKEEHQHLLIIRKPPENNLIICVLKRSGRTCISCRNPLIHLLLIIDISAYPMKMISFMKVVQYSKNTKFQEVYFTGACNCKFYSARNILHVRFKHVAS